MKAAAWIGTVLFATIGLYAGIGWMTPHHDVAEYTLRTPGCRHFSTAWRRADWMSAAILRRMAGTLFLAA